MIPKGAFSSKESRQQLKRLDYWQIGFVIVLGVAVIAITVCKLFFA